MDNKDVQSKMQQTTGSMSHKLLLDGRKKAGITGVSDVISFDLKEVLLETTMGMLTIKGQDLKVTRLSVEKGEMDVTGQIDSMVYEDLSGYTRKKSGLLKRMFE